MDEAENQINDMEHKEAKITNQNNKKKKSKKKRIVKTANICIIGVS